MHGSGIYSIAQVLPMITSVLLVPITTRYLTPADYAIQDLLSQVSLVVSALLGGYFAFSQGYFYFRAEEKDRKTVVGTGVLGSLLLGVIASAICVPLAGILAPVILPHADATAYLRLVFFLITPAFVFDGLTVWLRVADRPGIFVAAAALRAALVVVCTVYFLSILKWHIWGVLYSTTVALLVTLVVLAAYWLMTQGPSFNLDLFYRMARYALPLGLSGLAMLILHFGDSFMLPHYRPYADLGIYRLAYKVAMLISSVFGAFGIYWNSQVFQIMRRDDADIVFARLFTYVMVGISYAGLALIVCAHPLLRKLAGPAFQDAAALVPVLVIAYYLRCISEFMRALFLEAGRPSLEAATTWIGAAACLVGYALLIPKYGVWGAAYATLIAFGVLAVVAIVWSYRLRPYTVEGVRLAKIGIALAAAGVARVFTSGSSFSALVFSAALSLAIFPAVLLLLRFATPGEIALAQRAVGKLRGAKGVS